ncbi:PREDICTED: translation initiation factor IF-2-like, partial [Lepidothrix coronata]|uniref:Translation initiation factor IF-2-like n=1 Tax=Lepidothrix coronata TaxID=321398 RepID=A0A6J0JB77_9PASS
MERWMERWMEGWRDALVGAAISRLGWMLWNGMDICGWRMLQGRRDGCSKWDGDPWIGKMLWDGMGIPGQKGCSGMVWDGYSWTGRMLWDALGWDALGWDGYSRTGRMLRWAPAPPTVPSSLPAVWLHIWSCPPTAPRPGSRIPDLCPCRIGPRCPPGWGPPSLPRPCPSPRGRGISSPRYRSSLIPTLQLFLAGGEPWVGGGGVRGPQPGPAAPGGCPRPPLCPPSPQLGRSSGNFVHKKGSTPTPSTPPAPYPTRGWPRAPPVSPVTTHCPCSVSVCPPPTPGPPRGHPGQGWGVLGDRDPPRDGTPVHRDPRGQPPPPRRCQGVAGGVSLVLGGGCAVGIKALQKGCGSGGRPGKRGGGNRARGVGSGSGGGIGLVPAPGSSPAMLRVLLQRATHLPSLEKREKQSDPVASLTFR